MVICMFSRLLLMFEDCVVLSGPPQCPHIPLALGDIELTPGLSVSPTICLQSTGLQILCLLVFWSQASAGSLASEHLQASLPGFTAALDLLHLCTPLHPSLFIAPSPFWIRCQFKYRLSESFQPSLGYAHRRGALISWWFFVFPWMFPELTPPHGSTLREEDKARALHLILASLPPSLPPVCLLLKFEESSPHFFILFDKDSLQIVSFSPR